MAAWAVTAPRNTWFAPRTLTGWPEKAADLLMPTLVRLYLTYAISNRPLLLADLAETPGCQCFRPLLIEPERLNLASMLKKLGYETAAIGKWHLGYGTAPRVDYTQELRPGPLEIGFDYRLGVPSNHGG